MFNLLFIDTEGTPRLREIAILDDFGTLIYEATTCDDQSTHQTILGNVSSLATSFSPSYLSAKPSSTYQNLKGQSLEQIVTTLSELLPNKTLVFHYADHDIQVLQNTFRALGQPWPPVKVICTCQLAQQHFPHWESHALEYLSKRLDLRVEGKPFNPNLAHTARYDAEFTYELYRWMMMDLAIQETLKTQPNPFSSSRVDTPFQQHPDVRSLYQQEYDVLKALVLDIKQDPNHQSRGAVIIGEPGSGKTHLMMRLAQDLLQTNRILFIRQPNNPETVLFHIYSRVLESFVEPVPDSPYTQFEHFLARSFFNFLQSEADNLPASGKTLAQRLQGNHLGLFDALGRASSQSKRENWQRIERWLSHWWQQKYAGAGYSLNIIKGIIKYCSYSDPRLKGLVTRWLAGNDLDEADLNAISLEGWTDNLSREDFSLEAIAVFSKLSLLDEPLIIVFDQLEGLGLAHNQRTLLNFGEAIKELFTHVPNSLIILNLFPDRWDNFQTTLDAALLDRISQYVIALNRPPEEKLKQILDLKVQSLNIRLESLFTLSELDDIFSQASIRAVLNRAAAYYRHKVQGMTLPPVYETAVKSSNPKTLTQRVQQSEEDIAILKHQVAQLLQSSSAPLPPPTSAPHSPELGAIAQPTRKQPLTNPTASLVLHYLKEQEALLEEDYTKPKIIDDQDDIGKLIEITEAFHRIKVFEVRVLRLGKRKIPEHLVIQNTQQGNVLAFLHQDGSAFTSRLKNFNELVIHHSELHFTLLRDARLPPITGKTGKDEIGKLHHSPNGDFRLLTKGDRLELELLYKLIMDIHNGDIDVDLIAALEIVRSHCAHYWLIQKLLFTEPT